MEIEITTPKEVGAKKDKDDKVDKEDKEDKVKKGIKSDDTKQDDKINVELVAEYKKSKIFTLIHI